MHYFIWNMKKTIHYLGLLFFLMACKSENEKRIVGKWQAAQLLECDNIVPIQTDLVDIEFFPNGRYVFHSTLKVTEDGDYRIKKNFLFTQDKLRQKAPEKAVLIQSIDDDSLVLQMSYKGKDQWLTLVKDGVIAKNEVKTNEETQTNILAVATNPAALAPISLPNNPLDSAQKAAEKKKQLETEKAAERKKAEAEADKKREEAKAKSKKEENSMSASEAYKKREAKRKAEERKVKEEAEKKAEKFRRDYAKREAEKKKKNK